MTIKSRSFKATLALSAILAFGSVSFGSVLLFDDFDNGVVSTGATVHPNAWHSTSSSLVTESDGKVRIATSVASNAWGQTLLSTSMSPSLNFFNQPLTISVRDFVSGGTGASESTGQNFRLGLLGRTSTQITPSNLGFYQGADDGIALSITNGRTYALRYKTDRPTNGDPHIGARALEGLATGSLAAGLLITGFDLSVAATSWSMNLFISDGSTLYSNGDWVNVDAGNPVDLANAGSTWGNAADGWGNSALVIQAQKGNEGSGSVYMDMGSIVVTPEPGKFLLGALGLGFLALRRRR